MNISIVPDIKRKRKIDYRKMKGRITNIGSSNFLNKSRVNEHAIEQINVSRSELNKSQLVSVKQVNSFLGKNRELAKAVQNAKCQVIKLENEKISLQMENNKIRTKLNVATNGILKCDCEPSSNILPMLNNIKRSMSHSTDLFTEYMDLLAMEKVGEKISDHTILNSNGRSIHNSLYVASIVSEEKSVQTEWSDLKDSSSQTCFTGSIIATKNKKVQVYHSEKHRIKHLCCKDDQVNNGTQTEFDNISYNKQTNCPIKMNKSICSNIKDKKSAKRIPLKAISMNENIQSKGTLSSVNKNRSILKPTNGNKSFKIFEDGDLNVTKSSKKVTIQSPKKIFEFSTLPNKNDKGPSLRSREHRPIYTEIGGNKILRKGDRGVDVKFYYSPVVKKAKKKRRQKKTIPLQDVINMFEQSLLLSPIK